MSFVPLRLHSGFSYLESGLRLERIPVLASKRGYLSVGLCDEGTMNGYAPFFHLCQKANVKPIFGFDATVAEGFYSLYVKSEEGYRDLCGIALLASEGKLTLDELRKRSQNLLLVYSCDNALFRESYLGKDKSLAERLAARLKGFPEVYLGLPYHPNDKDFLAFCRAFAESHSYDLVAFPEIGYEKETDAIVLKIMKAIRDHETLSEKEMKGDGWFLDEATAEACFSPREIALTGEIAAKTSSFSYLRKRGGLLRYENDEGLSSSAYLRKLALNGLRKRQGDPIPKAYLERLDYELGVIDKMGYSDYFLIVGDYVNYAKTHGISVGPGRGSGAGSLVSYSLGIVTPDPIERGLLFERFLNPERQSMPDIDVDFSDVHREEVVLYLQRKYGRERVGHVLTTQTIGAKESLRDIGRVYGYEEREISLIASAIVDDKLSLRDDYRRSPRFRKLVDEDKYYLGIVALAAKIEGLPRQMGLHAAGIVLNDDPLPAALPVFDQVDGVGYVACLERDYLEEQGFLKMDLLGLRNLSIVDCCLSLIKEDGGPTIKSDEIPYEDKDAIALIRANKTMGLFQLESPGIRRALKEIDPTSFEDVAALLALFRPGPMASIPSYAKRKKGLEKIDYPAPELEPILKSTYGIIVYQEQIMQIVRVMAGFSYGQADLFRRAISKKDADKLAALKGGFLAGCEKEGKDPVLAKRVYDLIYKFADYGFNRSHAVSYAVLTCQMAYLKSHFPKEFYCAYLDFLSSSDAKFKDTVGEAKDLGIDLSCPSLNRSGSGFRIDGGKLIFPLSSIKGLQSGLVNALLDERAAQGEYQDLFDFAARGKAAGLNLQTLIRLIDAGALDGFGLNRPTLRGNAPAAMTYAEMMVGSDGKQVLLEGLGIEKPAIRPFQENKREDLDAEYAALGMMVSGSPLSFYKPEIEREDCVPLGKIGEREGLFKTVGIVKEMRAIVTRKGTQMAFLELYDETSEASFVLFSEAYAKCFAQIEEDKIVIVTAHRDMRRKDAFLVEDAQRLED
ncbi:MAG: DNA polymerase III subunit alpha [Bacilli bacterium]|jgi:DNA polymerase-3 subunit alpha|nr:DNA polymerase III subunit alpha [Bacilli bacterium]